MNSLLLRLYPAPWRARYGDEFEAILEERPLGPFDVADILLGALDAQLRLRAAGSQASQTRGITMSLRIGGFAAILGAALWAVAGLVNSGVFVDVDVAVPSILLVAGMPVWLVALAGLSAHQARTEATLAWVAFLVPAAGTVACLIGIIGILVATDEELLWMMFALGTGIAIVGSVLFAIVTYRTGTLSRAGSVLLGVGSVLFLTIGNPNTQSIGAVGLACIALGWFALGVQAIRASGPAVAPRIA